MIAAPAATTRGWSGLGAGLRSLGLSLSDEQCAKLIAYVELLTKWNRTYNLTAIREPAQMITYHLLDALAVLPHLPGAASLRLLDVGAGGGIPGIPLAIARPQWRVTMLDASQKKATFLTQAAIELALFNVLAVATRVEDFRSDEPFDVVISRAFADLATFARASAPQLAVGGQLYAMKGLMPRDEIAQLPASIEVVATPALSVPGLDAERHLVIMKTRGAGV